MILLRNTQVDIHSTSAHLVWKYVFEAHVMLDVDLVFFIHVEGTDDGDQIVIARNFLV